MQARIRCKCIYSIEYRCTVEMNNVYANPTVPDRELLSIGLVEEGFYEYLNCSLRAKSKHKRCVVGFQSFQDCEGTTHKYGDGFVSIVWRSPHPGGGWPSGSFHINLMLAVNMKERTFSVTDINGRTECISNIPDERVICFHAFAMKQIRVTQQSIQWV